MSDDNQWRWAEADGSSHECSFDELTQMLQTDQLPPYVLVWNTGWGSWLSARNVAEFAPALGPRAQPGTAPIRMPGLQTPPRPPLSKYKAVGHPSGAPMLKPAARPSPELTPSPGPAQALAPPPPARRSVPPPPPSTLGGEKKPSRPPPPPSRVRPPPPGPPATFHGTPPPPSLPPAPRGPVPIRDVMPTLNEEAPGLDRSTLRPARAVAPPPRMLPGEPLPHGLPVPPDVPGDSDVPDSLRISDGIDELPMPPVAAKPLAAAPSIQTPLPPPNDATPRTAEGAAKSPTDARLRTGPVRTAIIVGASIPIVALLAYLSRDESSSGRDDNLQPALSATADPSRAGTGTEPPSTASAERVPTCEVARRAQRLAAMAHLGVPPIAASVSEGKMALGFASSPTDAVGLMVDLETAEALPTFARSSRNGILGVVPGVQDGKTLFFVDVAGSPLVGLRTVTANPPFSLGVTADGFARRSGADVTVVWQSVTGADEITTPRIASGPEGHVLVTRVGGKTGRVMVGWLGLDGAPRGDLQRVTTNAAEIGTPGVTLSGGEALVTFAARGAEPDAPWGVQLAAVKPGQAATAETFALPPGGPGGPAISPATDALGGGRFLLVWTEGAPGSRDVRAQVLGGDLVKLGEPTTLSPAGSNAGQGVPFTQGGKALVVFYVKNETSQELWGATLKCR